MPDFTKRDRGPVRQKIPRIGPQEAARLFTECENLLGSSTALIGDLRRGGFAQFLTPLHEKILELAVQPDSWGERTRARLISEILAAVKGIPAETASVEDIIEISNVAMPCFLLELGRRKRHIEIEFPADAFNPDARFRFSVGPSYPIHSISNEQLSRLLAEAGEELVGLCYFGDQQSRERIEAELTRWDIATDSTIGR